MSSSRPELVVDWCSYQAAKYAVEHWHYSGSMPTPPVVRFGCWEDGDFRGVILFSRGSCLALGRPYGLKTTEVCELTRVALRDHGSYVSEMLGLALRALRNKERGLRLVVSFADPNEGHIGAIYQATNWLYTGMSEPYDKFMDASGRIWHPRQVSRTGVSRQYGEQRLVPKIADCERVPQLGKHRYLYPLDRAMRRQIAPLAKPYPKRGPGVQGDTPADQAGGPGSSPGVRS